MLHKIFCWFNFVGKGRRRKYFNDENFVIYGICTAYYTTLPAALLLAYLQNLSECSVLRVLHESASFYCSVNFFIISYILLHNGYLL